MPVVVSWPGGVFPGSLLTAVGGKRKKTRKITKSKKARKSTRKSRCWTRRG